MPGASGCQACASLLHPVSGFPPVAPVSVHKSHSAIGPEWLASAACKLGRLPRTVAESTLPPLMYMDFAVRCPLVRYSRLASGFCPSTRAFAWCFLQTPPRGNSPCTLLTLHLHQVERRTFTSKLLSMPSTQRSRSRGIEACCSAETPTAGCLIGPSGMHGPMQSDKPCS